MALHDLLHRSEEPEDPKATAIRQDAKTNPGEVTDLKAQVNDQQAQIDELVKTRGEFRRRVSQLQDGIAQANKATAKAERRFEDATEQNLALSQQVADLEEQLKTDQGEYAAQVEAKAERLLEANGSLMEKNAELNAKIADLDKFAADAVETIAELEKKVNALPSVPRIYTVLTDTRGEADVVEGTWSQVKDGVLAIYDSKDFVAAYAEGRWAKVTQVLASELETEIVFEELEDDDEPTPDV